MSGASRGRRARRGSGSITPRGRRFLARVDLGIGPDGQRLRFNKTFDTRTEAQRWIEQQHARQDELIKPVADQRLDEDLRWWLDHEAPKGKPGRAPLALHCRGDADACQAAAAAPVERLSVRAFVVRDGTIIG